MLGVDRIQRGQAVAAQRVFVKIGVGQAQIALIRTLIGVLEFELHGMRRSGRGIADLDRVILHVQPGVAAAPVDGLKAVRQPLMRLQQEAEAGSQPVAVSRVQAMAPDLAGLDQHMPQGALRDRR